MQLFLQISALVMLVWKAAALPDMILNSYTNSDTTENRKVIKNYGNYTFVGGVDYVSIINRKSATLNLVQISSFNPLCGAVNLCDNAMIIVEYWNSTTLFACGTYAKAPECFYINFQDLSFSKGVGLNADNFVTNSPKHDNPSLLLHNEHGPILYTATCSTARSCNVIRQIQNPRFIKNSDTKFDDPKFLSIYHNNGKVYTFFRDYSTAFQYDGFTKDGQRNEYGFVARVCTDDQSGVNNYVNSWITFVRARLVCPYPGGTSVGSSNIYYDVLTSTYQVGEMFYAVFSLPSSRNLPSSALCTYDVNVVDTYFDGTGFPGNVTLYYKSTADKILSPFDHAVPYLPGQCYRDVANQRDINDEYENFISQTTLLGATIPAVNRAPTHSSNTVVYKHVAAFEIGGYHVVCIFSNDGYMVKIRTSGSSGMNPVILFEKQIEGLVGDIVTTATVEQHILIATKTQVVEISTVACSLHKSCEACEADPHCDWTVHEGNELLCVPSLTNVTVDVCPRTPEPAKNLVNTLEYPIFSASWDGEASSYYVTITWKKTGTLIYQKLLNDKKVEINVTKDMKLGVSYLFSVYAVNGTTQSAAIQANITSQLKTPSFAAPAVHGTTVFLTWSYVTDAKSYNVTVLEDDSILFASIIVSPSTRTSLTLSGLSASTRYVAYVAGISEDDTPSGRNFSEFTAGQPTVSSVISSSNPNPNIKPTVTTTTIGPPQNTAPPTGGASSTTKNGDAVDSTITTQLKSESTTESAVKKNAEERAVSGKSDKLFIDTSSMLLTAAILGSVTAFCIGIFLYNCYSIGMSTNVIKAGKTNILYKRRCFCCWVPANGVAGEENMAYQARESMEQEREVADGFKGLQFFESYDKFHHK